MTPKKKKSASPTTPVSVWLAPEILAQVKEAAAYQAIPFTVFIRMAAKKETERVLRGKRRAA